TRVQLTILLLMELWQRYKRRSCFNTAKACLLTDPLCRILFGAMRSRQCPLTFGRHLACEPCDDAKLRGGFDQASSQIVLCSNAASLAAPDPCVSLRHELVHAFDACRAVADFDSSLDQLACTEIRAYNLAEPASWQKPAGGHADWVRQRAVDSVLTVRRIEQAEAETAVNRVFDRCYADLEPFGRRPLPPDPLERAELGSAQLAAKEAKFYGYWSECQSSS
ncbi:hypothetical protein BOX15_Mlig023839g2, partial [Macrostomum lignano]